MEWKLFADLADVAGEKRVTVQVEAGATVGDALDALVSIHPDLADRIYEDGDIAEHVNILRNGTNVFTAASGLDTPIEETDELAMFPPVSGG
ncbi:MAG: ubiquitin-like small modifier protein 1 [Halodesulfurarchaeum sp.]